MERFSDYFLILKDELRSIDGIKISGYSKRGDMEILLFTYEGTHAEIHFREDGFLDFSMAEDNKKLDKIVTEIVNILLDTKPCISFDEQVIDEDTILKCKEWYQDDSDAHVLRMLESYNEGELENTSNIRILTGKSLNYYEKRLKKIPGIYPGNLTKEEVEFVKNCSEYNLYYLLCKKTLELKETVSEEVSLDDYSEEELEMRFAVEYLSVQSSRFGTNVSSSTDYSPVILDMDYIIWLNSWAMYLTNFLDHEDIEMLKEMAEDLEDVYPVLTTLNSNMYESGIKHIFINKRMLEM